MPDTHSPPPARVIIADDVETNRLLMHHILDFAGYHCRVCEDGREVLELIRESTFDLALFDIMMPGLSGYELCQELKKNPATAEIPIIFVTSRTDPESVVKGFEAGAVDYIAKPFNPTELLARVRTHLSLRRSEQTLRQREQQLNTFLANIDDMICFRDLDGTPTRINQAYTRLTGLTEDMLAKDSPNWREVIHPRDLSAVERFFHDHPQGVDKHELEYRMRDQQGEWRWIHSRLVGFRGDRGITGYHCVGRDVTERKQRTEERLIQAATVFEHTSEAIVITDADKRITAVNRAFTRITGYGEHEVLGQDPRLLKSGQHDDQFYDELWRALRERDSWQGEIYNRRKDGSLFPVWQNITVVRDADGHVRHFISIFNDISAQKDSEEKIRYLAHYDLLTGLPNQVLFKERLHQALEDAAQRPEMMAVMFLDLDRFKQINDTLGHPVGDLMLQTVAERLQTLVRQPNLLARMSGDKFTVLLLDCENTGCLTQFSERLLAEMREPVVSPVQPLHLTVSLGVALYPQHGTGSAALLKNAEIAMYQAKSKGRNQYQVFFSGLETGAFENLILENDLRQAIDAKQLFLQYQPQVSLDNGRVIGAEALIRWQHPRRGLVPPDRFIRLAEESGLIIPIGEWVLRTACVQGRHWLDAGHSLESLAINFSSLQIQHPGIVETVAKVLAETGLPPGFLELELTESVIMRETREARNSLDALRELGVKLAVDDFGTGYSSLSYLRRLPIDKLKIDKSFVNDLPQDPNAAAIAKAVIALGKSLQLHVMAEGIENPEQQTFLHAHGCDSGQGFFYSRPVAADDFSFAVGGNG